MFRVHLTTREGGTYCTENDFNTIDEAGEELDELAFSYNAHYIGDELIVDGFIEDLDN